MSAIRAHGKRRIFPATVRRRHMTMSSRQSKLSSSFFMGGPVSPRNA